MLTARASLNWVAGLLIGLLVGVVLGVFLDQNLPDVIPELGIAPPGTVDTRELDQAIRIVKAEYYNPHLQDRTLAQGTVRGLIESLNDPFSEYLDPQQFQNEQSGFAGEYTGIGVYVDFNSQYPLISGVIPDSPAAKAGLHANDEILAVDGKSARNLGATGAAAAIQGRKGTVVRLTVQRAGKPLAFAITREPVTVPFVASRMFGSTLYVRIFSFGSTTAAQFNQVLQQKLPSAHGMVLDLRENPGGYVTDATEIIDDFISSGEAYQVRDRLGRVTKTFVSGPHPAAKIPVVVLVNQDSASAAEILSGCLQVHHRATLVGTRTFGKGSVQEDFPLFDGGDLHITVEHWFLPDGKTVQGVGLTPNVHVSLSNPDDMFDIEVTGSSISKDTQLETALKLLGS